MPKSCAFLTMENPDGFFVYDHLVVEPLRSFGWDVVEVPWSRPTQPWADFDAVVIRSPWDYQNAPDRFMATLASIQQSGTQLFNPLHICRWNLDKVYLKQLQQRGVPIVPTQWPDGLDDRVLANLLSMIGSSRRLVVKPTIGANADGIIVVSADDPNTSERAVAEYTSRPCMIQPFLSSILTVGEYSLFYFGGRYSHAILKQPKQGDFRVQEEHGGVIGAANPSGKIIDTAAHALRVVGESLLYARVDIVMLDDGSPAVTELELIEPSLYFSYDSDSPLRFAKALHEMWTHAETS